MSGIIALDTETTGLDPDTEDVFEVATIDLDTGRENVWCFEPRPEVVAAMHPKAVEVNRYHERLPDLARRWADSPRGALERLAGHIEGAHIVGAVPDFDTRHLTSLYRRFGVEPPCWHYHLIDVEGMAVGWLRHLHAVTEDESVRTRIESVLELPWRSDDLSRACGVEPPAGDERHTALGDARWVARWYRRLTGVSL